MILELPTAELDVTHIVPVSMVVKPSECGRLKDSKTFNNPAFIYRIHYLTQNTGFMCELISILILFTVPHCIR